MAESLPRHAWDSRRRRRKGALTWAWPPAAHAAPAGQGAGGTAVRDTHTIADHLAGIPPTPPATMPRPDGLPLSREGRVPPARLPGDAESVHARHSGTFTFLEQAIVALALIGGFLYVVSNR